MRHDPGENHDSYPCKAQIHSEGPPVVGAQHDMVHVPRESGDRDQGDVHDEECKKAEHGQEVDRPGGLSAAENARIPGETVHHRRRHGNACEYGQRAEDQNDSEVGNLLKCVVAVKSVGFGREPKSRVMNPGIPCLEENDRGIGHDAAPLLGGKEHRDENHAGEDKAVNVDEVPDPRNADCVPVARCAHQRRDVASVVFRCPDAIARDLQGSQANPFAAGRAAVVEIQARVIHQDGQPAANQQRHKQEIEEVAVTHPERKAVRRGEVIRRNLGNGRHMRHSGDSDLDPSRGDRSENRQRSPHRYGGSNPNAKAAIRRVMDGFVGRIE